MSGFIINLANVHVTALRQTAIDGIKNAVLGLRDVITLQGFMPGWNKSISGGTAEEPTRIMFKSTQAGTEWVAITDITWTSGQITFSRYMYSNDSVTGLVGSGTWTNLDDSTGKSDCTFTYDGSGNLVTTAWS